MSEKKRVLCVDDDEITRAVMAELLHRQFDFVAVDSGGAALEYLRDSRVDLILLDVQMPGIDGLETCRCLKQKPATSRIPVIFVSGYASDAERMAGYEAGGVEYIAKPFEEDELLIKVSDTLEKAATLAQCP